MNIHANAALSLKGRRQLAQRVVDQDWSLTEAAAAAEVSERTAGKWARRYRDEGEAGLLDRSSRPKRSPSATAPERIEAIASLRRATRMTAAQIAEVLEMPLKTVQGLLRRLGLGKRWRLEAAQVVRYERSRAGELVHIDVKKLGRIVGGAGHRVTGRHHYNRTFTDREGHRRQSVGYECVHVAIDDFSRLAYVEVLPDEKAATAAGFLKRTADHFASQGVRIEGVLTDNGSPYRSTVHAVACRMLGLRHLRTRPGRPQTNGKAERFIRTMLDGWAYGRIYRSSAERTRALGPWLDFYNRRRPHSALGLRPPVTRLTGNNVLGSYN